MKKYYLFIGVLIMVSLLVVGLQINTGKGPAKDKKIVSDISLINAAVDRYTQENRKMPAKLSDLDLESDLKSRLANYEYKVTAREKYEICAVFETDATNKYQSSYSDSYPDSHKKGYQCFKQESYLPYEPPPNPIPARASTQYPGLCGQTVAGFVLKSQTLLSIDTKTRQLSTSSVSNSKFTWTGNEPPAYNSKCAKITLSELKLNDLVDVYYQSDILIAIQKQTN